jgi:hypothetical protein
VSSVKYTRKWKSCRSIVIIHTNLQDQKFNILNLAFKPSLLYLVCISGKISAVVKKMQTEGHSVAADDYTSKYLTTPACLLSRVKATPQHTFRAEQDGSEN